MKKTITINIAATAFFIDDDAYESLKKYQQKLENWFRTKEGAKEIINDIEARMAELFAQRINPKTGVITVSLVEEVISIMGQPEDFSGEGDAEEEKGAASEWTGATFYTRKRLYRDLDNKVLGGVCGGIAAYFNLDPVLVRIIFAVLPFLSFGAIIPVYIVLWIAVPPAVTTTQRLEMRGENITVSNIEKNIKEQYENVKSEFSNFKKSKTYKDGEAYLNKMKKRDKNVFIFVAIVIGLLFFTRMIGFHGPAFHFVHMPFAHLAFPGIVPLLILILILALIFRSAMKGFLILIAVIIVIGFIMMLTGGISFFPWHMALL
jgi:phage shock protein PspC (stress-responsive transcriptional regulator)